MSEIARRKHKAKLERLLGASTQCVTGLKELLARELAALERQDVNALNSIAVDKQLHLAELDGLEAKRGEICSACGFGSGPEDMHALARWCGDDSLIIDSWTDYIGIATECNDLNQANGAVIRVRRSQLNSALSLLRGGDQGNEVYGPTGREADAHTIRALAKA